jgi:aryl-alcohol dehydrogenase
MKIKAAVLHAASGNFSFQDVELGEPRTDEVLVRVVASGVCHTDVRMRQHPGSAPLPLILGHEGAGVVEKVGAGVQDVAPGDRVIMSYPFCGRCRQCLSGHPAYCADNIQLCFRGSRTDGSSAYQGGIHGHFFGQSSFATHSMATARNVIKVSADVPLELLAPLGCGLQTGAGAVLNALKVEPGASIAIFGTGSVGMAAIMAARIAGASTIIAVDINNRRLTLAEELGATHIINGACEDVSRRILDITGAGADYILELTGNPDMLSRATEVLAQMGTVAVIAGSAPGTRASIETRLIMNGRTLRGVIQGDSISKLFLPQLIAHYKAGRFPFDRLVRLHNFEEIETAFEDSHSGLTLKPVLRIGTA